ncbi:hypothetical protein NDU88_004568 [Pleurodeles waltl]|uniref:Uncharacterized protein n=1 Tax=Pleurodeles waltl TaxID=8319 RepID=A0AAV7MAF5_PLEWA|nr:hypothetical protein NDU88_004568 [Pleurodeles waltl]
MEDSDGQRKVGGTPPAFRFWPRLYRRGQNARRSTASLLAVLPPTSALAVITARYSVFHVSRVPGRYTRHAPNLLCVGY